MMIHNIPTGKLIVDTYSKGQLETLSIGDYGKSKNIKADFLGFTNEINGVASGTCLPLSEKWVITVSTQFGCQCDCVSKLGPCRGNATFDDLQRQFYAAIRQFPNVKYTDRLNLHYARMGEPIFNNSVLEFTEWLYLNKTQIKIDTGLAIETLHPVLTSSCPDKFRKLEERLHEWCRLKNDLYNGQAGLQLSINSTSDDQRTYMFKGMQASLDKLSQIGKNLPAPLGRKYTLNFAYATGYEVDGAKLATLFDPEKFMVKITPIHNNAACIENGIQTVDGYHSFAPYTGIEENLKQNGFDVLVFIPSTDEENGLVTCGNAILSGSEITCQTDIVKIQGL